MGQIENPNYFEDNNPFTMKPIAAVGFELWSMQSEILFDNIIIADDLSLVEQWTLQTWDLKHSKEVASDPNSSGMWKSFMDTMNEKPWLWVVVVLAIALPIILIYFLCCRKGDKVAISKKTDEVLPDDEGVEDEAIQDVNEEVDQAQETNESESKPSEDEDVSAGVEEEVKDKEVEKEVEKDEAAVEKEIQPEVKPEPVENSKNSSGEAHIEDIPSNVSDKINVKETDKNIQSEDVKDISNEDELEKDASEELPEASEKVEVAEGDAEDTSLPEEIPQ